MSRQERSEPVELDRLTESIGHLTDRLQLVGDTLDAIREDLNWLTRNPIRLEVECTPAIAGTSRDVPPGELNPAEVNAAATRLMASLQSVLATVSAEQVEQIIEALDDAHSRLLPLMRGDLRQAIHLDQASSESLDEATCEAGPSANETQDDVASAEVSVARHNGPPGRLF